MVPDCILRRAAMSVLPCVTLAVALATFADAFSNLNERDKVHNFVTTNIQNGNGVTGVAATSVSAASVGDTKLLPIPGLTMSNDGDTMSFAYPINDNHGIATGVIRMKPGSVAVASSSYSTAPDWQQSSPAFNHMTNWPMVTNYAIHPQMPVFGPQIIQPWFFGNMMDGFGQYKPVYRNTWMYPNYNPFVNFWR